MKRFFYYPIVACAFGALAACNGQKQAEDPTAGIRLANMDTTAKCGTEFYEYACGGWMKAHPLTGEYSSFGTFDMLRENNLKQLQDLITEIAKGKHEQGTVAQKIGDLYNMAMDSVKRNADGMKPIKEYYDMLAGLKDKSEYAALLGKMQRDGLGGFFGFYIGADQKNSKANIIDVYQGGLTLGQKEYYIDTDSVTMDIMDNYKKFMVKMFQLAGETPENAEAKMNNVLTVETALAKISKSNTELRDPHANYNKMTYAQLKKDYAGFDWNAYFGVFGIKDIKDLTVGQTAFVKGAIKYMNEAPVAVVADYLQWNLLNGTSSYLSDEVYNTSFDFYGRVLSGKEEQSPRWKRCVSAVDGTLGEAVGELYVEKYFPAAAKERMVELVNNLKISLGQRIDMQSWMSDETKKKAHEKLDAFYVKVGYPDKWRDYSALEINAEDSYAENILRSVNFEYDYMCSKLGKPVDKTEWMMTPQTVNAYYNPTTNEICFPAGILQYPFFDMNADDAFNYGAIGVVIGHEMTHGFDDQGSQYDKDGNLVNWWTEEDAARFKERTQVMVNFFDSIEVLPGLNANGALTLGENIADHGGLKIAFQAFQNATANSPLPVKLGFTPEQRFFIAYATLWASNMRDEYIRLLTKSDVHALGKWRVDGALPHIQAWYDAFGITENDPMFVPVEERVDVW